MENAEGLPENYIVLSNHVTDYDPLLVGVSFPGQMYFVASEHITRWDIASLNIEDLTGLWVPFILMAVLSSLAFPCGC